LGGVPAKPKSLFPMLPGRGPVALRRAIQALVVLTGQAIINGILETIRQGSLVGRGRRLLFQDREIRGGHVVPQGLFRRFPRFVCRTLPPFLFFRVQQDLVIGRFPLLGIHRSPCPVDGHGELI
jgi:hypothetical protein